MSVELRWEGLSELREALRQLPEELTGEASHIVEGKANAAAADIKQGYAAKMKHAGELQNDVSVTHAEGQFSAGAIVKNTSKLAFIFENGTEARHYISVHGVQHVTGRIPPLHVFIPAVIKRRREMYQQLKDLLVRKGLFVSGDER